MPSIGSRPSIAGRLGSRSSESEGRSRKLGFRFLSRPAIEGFFAALFPGFDLHPIANISPGKQHHGLAFLEPRANNAISPIRNADLNFRAHGLAVRHLVYGPSFALAEQR